MLVNSRARANNFDSLRLIFALLVIFSHSFPLGLGSYRGEPLWQLTGGQIELGKVSVWGFFAISGFLITKSWFRTPSALKFLARRIGRIYPGFIAVSLIGAAVIVPLASDAHTHDQISIRRFISSTLRLNNWEMPPVFMQNAHPGVLNGSLWSIPYEFWCYIIVLILGLCHLLQRRHLVLALFLCVIGWHFWVDLTGWTYRGRVFGEIFGDPITWATVLPFFLAGSVFHLFAGDVLLRKSLAMLAMTLLIVSFFIPHAYIVTMPICGVYVLMFVAYLPALNRLNLGRYGDFSYGVYLYAFPVQQLLVMGSGGHMSPYALFAAAAPISLALGALSWFLIERHFVFRRPRKGKSAGEASPSFENAAS